MRNAPGDVSLSPSFQPDEIFPHGKYIPRILVICAVLFLALRFWHLAADFPNYHFYSQDHARLTDEGFYTGAALHFYTLGHAYIPGGWNPGVFMPVWPFLTALLFHFTGISAVAARALAVALECASVWLAYGITRQYRSRTFAACTTLLFSINALGFFFGRLALLEPAFVFWILLAMYCAVRTSPESYFLTFVTGMVFVTATLTKTTAPFLLPAVLFPLWSNHRTMPRIACKLIGTALLPIVLLLGAAKIYWHLHYASDAAIILGIAPLWQLEHAPLRLLRFFYRGTWIDPVLFPLALAAAVAAIVRTRKLWRDPLFTLAFLWAAGYAGFIVFHYDGPPRYFMVLILPIIWLSLLFTEWIAQHSRTAGTWMGIAIACSAIWNIGMMGHAMLHPQYTLLYASRSIRNIITTHSGAYPDDLLIGRGADEISLLSGGIPTMDSDGAMPLAEKLNVYRPGWFMQWSSEPMLRQQIVEQSRHLDLQGEFRTTTSFQSDSVALYRLSLHEK